MTWELQVGLAVAGMVASGVAVLWVVIKGVEYHRFLPKKRVYDSLETLRQQHAEAEDRLEELRSREAEANALIHEAETQRGWMERMKEGIAHLESRRHEIEETDRELTKKLSDLSEAEEKSLQFQKALDEARIHLAKVGEEVARKEKAVQELTSLLKQVNATAPGHGADDPRRVALLWAPALREDDFLESLPVSLTETDALSEAGMRIESRGLRYDDRVLRAFHTALKCAEESPLLVLAGISGTGKSALPAAYAEAMGMHFLNIPVQPGWDSPADLLGFYNHLEQRYKPTELARALMQMDPVERDDWPEPAEDWRDLSDRMLLVLLDEMNLARVEYYFSEFLSRLEERRGVDPDDVVARRRAELQLDLGGGSDGKAQTLSIFPGRNVLFAGTMNEDESTQTLSDKVIDRSNVMRFGRPDRLSAQRDGADEYSRQRKCLLCGVWQGWIDGASEPDPEIERWIEQSNEILSKVGRPFGHRVAKAMLRYVQLYPDGDSYSAMADQVEFRILPRLRGLDLHEPSSRDAIEATIQLLGTTLGDAVLAEALSDAIERMGSDQLFVWSGVDRLKRSQGVGAP